MPVVADALLTLANVLIMISTAPTLLNEDAAVPRWQSAIMVVALLLVTVGQMLLHVYFSAATVFLSAIGWLAILLLRPA